MKIGICAGAKEIVQLKQGTADYVEMCLTQIYSMTNSEIKETIDILETAGVPAEASNGFFPGNIKICGKAYKKQQVAEYCKKALYNGAQLGIHTCVLGSGKARNVDDGENRSECLKQLEEAIFIAGEAAKEFDTTVVIETLNKNETNLINTVAEGAAMCRKINHTNVMLHADIYHIAQEKEPFDVIWENSDIIKHIHISHPESRLYPLEHDGFDYTLVKNAIDKAGYDLRISIEGIRPEKFVKGAEDSLLFLKSIFK